MIIKPIDVTDVGISTYVREDIWKAPWSILVTDVGIMILVMGQFAYWYALMLVVPAGIVTDENKVNVYRLIPATS